MCVCLQYTILEQALNFIKQSLNYINDHINPGKIIVRDFNTLLSY